MYSYRSHIYRLYTDALGKGVATALAHAECIRHRSECAEFPAAFHELEGKFRELEVATQALFEALPEDVRNRGELWRHLGWGSYWLQKKRQPSGWGNDPQTIVEHDLPAILEAFDDWYMTASEVDPHYVDRLSQFDSSMLINSAAREAWTIVKTQMVETFNLPNDLDGPRLLNCLLGDNGPAASMLSDKERRAFRDLLNGLYSLHRNQISHNDTEPNPAVAEAVVTLLGLCLARIAPQNEAED